MSNELTVQESNFIDLLIETGSIQKAAEEAGFNKMYGYMLRKRLSKHIVEAATDYLAINSVKAAKKVVDTIDAEMPNPIHLQAAQAVLDRAGIIKKDSAPGISIKANIFILPEKNQPITIDNE